MPLPENPIHTPVRGGGAPPGVPAPGFPARFPRPALRRSPGLYALSPSPSVEKSLILRSYARGIDRSSDWLLHGVLI